MCGLVGIAGRELVSDRLFDALTVLQHRGQDAAGIVTQKNRQLFSRKGNGLVRDVFRAEDFDYLVGESGIGQVRYPTAGTLGANEAQPFYVNSPYGITLAHNGNLTNAEALRRELFESDCRHINTGSDSEVLLNILAHELVKSAKTNASAPEQVFAAVEEVHQRCHGAYAAVALIVGVGMLAFRDPHGVRPLILGQREQAGGLEYMLASESVALDMLDFTPMRDLRPGEAILITPEGELHEEVCAKDAVLTPCIFEHVYLARPDSILDGVSVYKARLRAGEFLVQQVLAQFPSQEKFVDVVMPIPDTSRTAALPLAHQLGVKHREGFIKNRYIGRTFIMPNQQQRNDSVLRKLNPIGLEFEGKNVLLVDDSIVRGTTSRQIIKMARKAGAKKVYLASASPPIRYSNVYGIDMPTCDELIAANDKTDAEIAKDIGADKVIYLQLDQLVQASQEGNPAIKRFECSAFDGQYLTDEDADYAKWQSKHYQARACSVTKSLAS